MARPPPVELVQAKLLLKLGAAAVVPHHVCQHQADCRAQLEAVSRAGGAEDDLGGRACGSVRACGRVGAVPGWLQ